MVKQKNVLYADITKDFNGLEAWSKQPSKIDVIQDDDDKLEEIFKDRDRIEETLIETSQDEDIAKNIANGLGDRQSVPNNIHKEQDPTIKGVAYMGYMKPYTDDRYWEKAFPHLFPYGCGGPNDVDRQIRLTDASFDRHAMLESSNRFSSSKQWIFARYKTACSRSANSVSYIASKYGENLPTVRQLFEVREHAKCGINRSRVQTETEILLKQLSSFGGKVNNPFPYQAYWCDAGRQRRARGPRSRRESATLGETGRNER